MKKTVLSTVFCVFTLLASACGSAATATQAGPTTPASAEMAPTTQPTAAETVTSVSTAALDDTYENAVSIEYQLVLGTLSLENTDLAVTAEQAATLLTLWQNYQSLDMGGAPGGQPGGNGGTSPDQSGTPPAQDDTASTPQAAATPDAAIESEKADLLTQIQVAMTSAQIQAITDLKITTDNAQTLQDELDISVSSQTRQAGTGTSTDTGTPAAPLGQGTGPETGPGGNQMGTPAAGQPDTGAQMGIPGGDQTAADGSTPRGLFNMLQMVLADRSGTTLKGMGPGGSGGQMAGGQPPSGSGGAPSGQAQTTENTTKTAAYTLDGQAQTVSDQTYTAAGQDESAVYVINGGALTLSNATIGTSGNTSSQDSSSFYGLNAAVLAESGGLINLSDSSISTTGTGANGAFASGDGSTVNLSNVTINATADGGHGVMATLGGTLTLNNVNIYTAGGSSGAIATDRGSGTITVTGGTVTTSGQNSPGIYSTGAISVTGGTFTATGAESAVIEGANSITLTDTSLTSGQTDKWGVLIYQSMSGDAEGTEGTFTMTGGSLSNTAATGALFYVTNSTGVITLKAVDVSEKSGTLINTAAGNWGTEGKNGGTVIFTADGQTLSGDITADAVSMVTATLQNGSTLTGAVNTANTAKAANLTLDASSSWNVSADSYLNSLTDSDGISGTSVSNITGNGHTVYYDASSCPALNGLTYDLVNGGTLTPAP